MLSVLIVHILYFQSCDGSGKLPLTLKFPPPRGSNSFWMNPGIWYLRSNLAVSPLFNRTLILHGLHVPDHFGRITFTCVLEIHVASVQPDSVPSMHTWHVAGCTDPKFPIMLMVLPPTHDRLPLKLVNFKSVQSFNEFNVYPVLHDSKIGSMRNDPTLSSQPPIVLRHSARKAMTESEAKAKAFVRLVCPSDGSVSVWVLRQFATENQSAPSPTALNRDLNRAVLPGGACTPTSQWAQLHEMESPSANLVS